MFLARKLRINAKAEHIEMGGEEEEFLNLFPNGTIKHLQGGNTESVINKVEAEVSYIRPFVC